MAKIVICINIHIMKLPILKGFMHFDTLDSTNLMAMRLINSGLINRSMLISSDFQSKGRGQRNKYWESKKGDNLLLSIVLFQEFFLKNLFDVNIITSLSLLDLFLSYEFKDVSIKWPNDILIHDKKISGLLIENKIINKKSICSVIGIGCNINQREFNDYNRKATSFFIEKDAEFDIKEIQYKLISCFEKRVMEYHRKGCAEMRKIYVSKMYLKDKESEFEIDKKRIFGIIRSVNSKGQLVLDIKGSKRKVVRLSEISFLS